MPRNANYYRTGLTVLLLLAAGAAWYGLRTYVAMAHVGTAPDWFRELVDALYPRFTTEKHRFPAAFFIEKFDQVFLRFLLVVAGSAVVTQWKRVRMFFQNFLQDTTSRHNVAFLRISILLFLLQTTHEWYFDLVALHKAVAFYDPIPLYRLLHLPFPHPVASLALYGLMVAGAVLALLNIRPVLSATTAILLFILLQGYFYCFGKIDHGYTTYTYALLLLPFLLYNASQKSATVSAWPLKLTQLVIALVYLLTGLEKLLVSHFTWASAETFRAYLLVHAAPAGLWVAESDFLCTILPVGALGFQLGFPLILFYRKLKYPLLAAGVLFHFGTVVLFGISSFWNPWVVVYVFFIDWERVVLTVKKLRVVNEKFKTPSSRKNPPGRSLLSSWG